MKIAYFGPWFGEFGWELLTWQGFCRAKSQEYDKVYVCSFPDMEFLYKDFAEFIPHTHTKRALDWKDISTIDYDLPLDVTTHIKPFKQYRVPDQSFIRLGNNPIYEYDYLIHARAISKGGNKNYPAELWELIVQNLQGKGASIGTSNDLHIPNTEDLRGIELEKLTNYIAGSKVVIGQSSGVMHLATLCTTPIVVWGDRATYFSETLDKRYKVTWNPFGSRVEFIFDDFWRPEAFKVVDSVNTILEIEPGFEEIDVDNVIYDDEAPEIGNNIPSLDDIIVPNEPELIIPKKPENLIPITKKVPLIDTTIKVSQETAKVLQSAMESGKWLITATYIANQEGKEKLFHVWESKDFPKNDMIASMEHLKLDIAEKQVNPTKIQGDRWK